MKLPKILKYVFPALLLFINFIFVKYAPTEMPMLIYVLMYTITLLGAIISYWGLNIFDKHFNE